MSNRVPPFDFSRLTRQSLDTRPSLVELEQLGQPHREGATFAEFLNALPDHLAARDLRAVVAAVCEARKRGRPVILGMGAHPVKVGLSPLIIDLIRRKILTAVAVNGAVLVHDYESAVAGKTSEDVEAALADGSFGVTHETGRDLARFVKEGAEAGLGLAEAVGRGIASLDAPYREHSLLAFCEETETPATAHVAIGTDVTHLAAELDFAALGALAGRDFARFVTLVSDLDGGVYINLGSAVLLPEVFLKAVSASRNAGRKLSPITTVNLDFLRHYRPLTNVVHRPTRPGDAAFTSRAITRFCFRFWPPRSWKRAEKSSRIFAMSKRVLVGESNYAEFEVLNDLLSAKGFQVTWLKNGRDVVTQFPDVTPDLMILDALLPGMTGLKVTQEVKSMREGRDVKIILMSTVYGQFREQYEARRQVGVDAYTEKPVNVGELERLINELLGDGRYPEEETAVAEDFGEAAPAAVAVEAEPEPDPAIDAQKKVGLEGDLGDIAFPKLLFYLHKYARTGALRLERERVSKVVYLQSGLPVLVTSNQATESLGRFLVQRRDITTAQYNASLERMLETGKQHGQVLLEMEAITPHGLYKGLYDHVMEKVLTVFSWDRGRYRFRPGRFEINQDFTINVDPIQILYEGIKRFYTLSRLEGFFNEYKNRRVVRVNEPFVRDDKIGFGPQTMKFVTLINGRRTVGQIVARSNLSLTETFQTLFLLLVLETLRFRGEDHAPGVGAAAHAQAATPLSGLGGMRTDKIAKTGDPRISFRAEVNRAHARIDRLNFYEILSIAPSAPVDRVKASYFALSKHFHDHKLYSAADETTRKKADEIFMRLTEAYTALVNPTERAAYDAGLAKGAASPPAAAAPGGPAVEPDLPPLDADLPPLALSTEDAPAETAAPVESKPAASSADELDGLDTLWEAEAEFAPAGDTRDEDLDLFADDGEAAVDLSESAAATENVAEILKAELAFQEGEDALRDLDFNRAVECFDRALDAAPNEAEYHGYLGWAVYRRDPGDAESVERARRAIAKGVAMNPTMDAGHYFLGMIASQLGEKRGRAQTPGTGAPLQSRQRGSSAGSEEAGRGLGGLLAQIDFVGRGRRGRTPGSRRAVAADGLQRGHRRLRGRGARGVSRKAPRSGHGRDSAAGHRRPRGGQTGQGTSAGLGQSGRDVQAPAKPRDPDRRHDKAQSRRVPPKAV
ncbi:MAG: response regulator [Deltaproteobacteria bacterium]|nr:response regulator [Deltaproteobacteria bacterium]